MLHSSWCCCLSADADAADFDHHHHHATAANGPNVRRKKKIALLLWINHYAHTRGIETADLLCCPVSETTMRKNKGIFCSSSRESQTNDDKTRCAMCSNCNTDRCVSFDFSKKGSSCHIPSVVGLDSQHSPDIHKSVKSHFCRGPLAPNEILPSMREVVLLSNSLFAYYHHLPSPP